MKMRTRMLWSVDGKNGMSLVGFDEATMTEQARIETGATHWSFSFAEFSGSGRVRVGVGCDYNPIQMIEAMWEHIAFGGLDPSPEVTFDPAASYIGAPLGDATEDLR
jgi:hypothetical protein